MAWKEILCSERFQRKLTVLVALIVMLGVAAAITAAVRSQTMQANSPSPTLNGMMIVVDPGHGGYDGGARAWDSGVWEKELNLQVALCVKEALLARGAQVTLTRETDVDLCSEPRPANLTRKRQDMEARIALAKSVQADMVLSIHMNEYRDRKQAGPQVFYRAQSASGRLLAGCMQDALIDALEPPKKRSAQAGDYFILQLDVPSVLVECGFLSNPAEEKLLRDPAYQRRLADAIADAAEEYTLLTRSNANHEGMERPDGEESR